MEMAAASPEHVPESRLWNVRLFDIRSPRVPFVRRGRCLSAGRRCDRHDDLRYVQESNPQQSRLFKV